MENEEYGFADAYEDLRNLRNYNVGGDAQDEALRRLNDFIAELQLLVADVKEAVQ